MRMPAWWHRWKRRDMGFLLPRGWIVLVPLFFSFSPGKRDVYILPALPMMALAVAPLLSDLLRRCRVRIASFALTLLPAGALTAAASLAIHRHPTWALKVERILDPGICGLLLTIGIAGLIIVALTRVRRSPLGPPLFVEVPVEFRACRAIQCSTMSAPRAT